MKSAFKKTSRCLRDRQFLRQIIETVAERGRNRIHNKTYFQQHAEPRMTRKAMKGNSSHANRARIERAFARSYTLLLREVSLKYPICSVVCSRCSCIISTPRRHEVTFLKNELFPR
ncbi:MAG: hypothetical protein DMG92_17990 [Acidobacteria bacterium]|nr:MAG: hypothetical protein DMG92_17990 [Acidobacteriota bacterium]